MARLAAVLVALSALTGCGAFYDDEPVGRTASSGANRYPLKGDNKPHPGVARAHRHAVHGIDVARYQGDIDWAAVRKAGTRFAFIKATEGGDYIDPNFRRNWTEARRNGIPRGAYHFVYWCRPAQEQADWFVRNVPAEPDALPPVLDLEWNNHSRTCTRKVSREDAIAKTRILLEAMERHTGKVPIIYTDINFHRDVLEGMHLDNPFWLRSTAAEPHERFRNRRWSFWQWTQTGTMPGIAGEVDRNVFYGTDQEWQTFAQTGCDPRDLGKPALSLRCGTGGRPSAPLVAAAPAAPPPPAPLATPPVMAVAYDGDELAALISGLAPIGN